MGKGHRDNHRARKKRGKVAFDKKAKRRRKITRCNLCGVKVREKKLIGGLCPICFNKPNESRQITTSKEAGLH